MSKRQQLFCWYSALIVGGTAFGLWGIWIGLLFTFVIVPVLNGVAFTTYNTIKGG